ncbi:hypothetical protein V6N13_107844 [Hibiscus sabdariffa]
MKTIKWVEWRQEDLGVTRVAARGEANFSFENETWKTLVSLRQEEHWLWAIIINVSLGIVFYLSSHPFHHRELSHVHHYGAVANKKCKHDLMGR